MAMMSPVGAGGGRRALNANLPLVPILDLLLCCLMFLLVTAVWNQLACIQTAQRVPGQSGPPEETVERIRLMLSLRKGGYELSSTVGERQWLIGHDTAALGEALRGRRSLGDQRWDLTIATDDDVAYEHLIAAMDVALANGFHAIDVSGAVQ